ncbi:hypothetical protein [Alkalihalobacillus deserti]|uniref:hypothetical protein n=1 Tax=Alkalihalobacillus deserti TaxID=2879466 RepID=UPI001D13A266|nr:hypothetical protein [Alkalihalobacillus deserti]
MEMESEMEQMMERIAPYMGIEDTTELSAEQDEATFSDVSTTFQLSESFYLSDNPSFLIYNGTDAF